MIAGTLAAALGVAQSGEIQVPTTEPAKRPPSVIILGPSATPPPSVADPETAALMAKAKAGDHDAQWRLGKKALEAKPPKLDDAFKWLQLAADGGHAEAAYDLAVLYENGWGRPKNAPEAAKWYRVGAERGHALSQAALAKLYQADIGVPQDYAEALRWARASADQNNAAGESNLATMYANGIGVAPNPAEAVRLYRLSADQGNAVAQANLGFLYTGAKGVTPKPAAAYFWLNLAAARLPPSLNAMRDQVAKARDAVSAKLASTELARMQQLAGAWKPGSTDVPSD